MKTPTSKPAPERFDFRVVKVKGALYLRREDVAEFFRNISATEPDGDVRIRLEAAARNILLAK